MALGPTGYPNTAEDNRKKEDQQQCAANQAKFLAAGREDEIGVPLRQIGGNIGLSLFAFEIAHSCQLTGPDGDEGTGLLPTGTQRVESMVKYHTETQDTVVAP